MKVFAKRLIALTIIVSSMISCQESTTEDVEIFDAETTLNKDEVLSLVESVIVNYPVTGVTNNSTTTTINNDFDMEDYAEATNRPRLNFPFDITVDGEVITIHDMKQLKELIKRNKGRKRPEFVFPISVTLSDGTTQEIADQDALKAYYESLDKGDRPVYVFPLSIIKNGETIVINSQEELDALCGK